MKKRAKKYDSDSDNDIIKGSDEEKTKHQPDQKIKKQKRSHMKESSF